MKLIAKKPCSFGGKQFFIGDEIPSGLVLDAKMQEKLGVVAIANNGAKESETNSDVFFSREQVEKMVAEAVNNTVLEMKQKELQEEGFLSEGTVKISVKGDSDEDNGRQTVVLATPEEIQMAFSIMQMNAADGAEAIAGIGSENVLILLHAADTRKTIKDAAKKQTDNIFSISDSSKGSVEGNVTTGANPEGVDT